ncbi:protein lava lamp-like isoform X2 [Physella acuta]|uniref:protein lava lamp-like isoform X2 n=1 Tax=Physella acuta TaxID=109671 RepID=UPI0027DD3A59|nr:protein lava lamp-like isoform X2 [Physella acuta]
MLEHLQLQKSHALLQKQGEHIQDPQREALAKMALQNDLFNAQCRIEKLEQMINEIGEGEVLMLLKEREAMLANTKEAQEKACFWENQSRRLQHELNKAVERSEELEFQLMEIENSEDDRKNSSCNENTQDQPLDYHELTEQLAETSQWLRQEEGRMDDLRKELAVLLKGKGREGDAVLKKLEKIQNEDKKHAASLESMANELQMKVISLQEEKNSLLDSLKLKGIKPGKVDNSSSASAAREKQENLELKAELTKLIHSENKLIEERIHLQDELEDWKTQYEYLKQQLDILTKSQPTHTEDYSVRSAAINSSLTRKPSKSKPRGGESPSQSKRRKSSQDEPSSMDMSDGLSKESFMRSFSSCENLQTMTGSVGDTGDMRSRVRVLENDLEKMKDENYNLKDQLKQSVLEKSSEAEADQQILMDKVRGLEAELDLMKRENVALSHKLKQRIEEFNDSQDEMNPRLSELEEYCEDLQERLHAAEMSERQMREKLRLVEGSIDDAETSELAAREKYEELLARDAEAKQHIRQLQRTGHELRDLILDKDIMEQALRDKVDFLQKAEAASVKRIEELEAIEKDLRDQLEMKLDSKNVCQREVHKIQELKHQITFLETDNKAMSARIAELEENEETLRENWRRVADEDFNRTQSLEEKVKMLEGVNRDLKAKLMDAQEYFVINTVRPTENSLAAELAMSQSRLRASVDSVDGFKGDGEEPKPDPEKKTLVEKLRKLERKLSDVSEKKNTEIETLQERIVSLRENELKLSETISEMEMTERELRAKLALYESSEVTVEKMLKYQSKIEELRTSQESLLDQLESMENQEMTLQEKMQEMERTLRGKIVTLEVEMKGFKQKELKHAARIRELEKSEKELSEKMAQQAEKENGLYVKISSLMDQLKTAKEKAEHLQVQLADKEDKVRKAQLLDVKRVEAEMEYGKKVSDMSTKLRHKEEEMRVKDAAHKEEVANLQSEISTLQAELSIKESEKNQRISILQRMFAQKENDLQSKIAILEENNKELTAEKLESETEIRKLKENNSELLHKDTGYEKEMDILREEVTFIQAAEKEHENKVVMLEENIRKERHRADEAEKKVVLLEKEVSREKDNVLAIESKLIALKGDIAEKMRNIESSFIEKESEYEKEIQSLQQELDLKAGRVTELEKEQVAAVKRVKELEAECAELKSKAASSESGVKVQMLDLEKQLKEKNKIIDVMKESNDRKEKELKSQLDSIKAESHSKEQEMNKKITFLNTQLLQEVATRESLENSKTQSESKEVSQLKNEVSDLKKEVSELRKEVGKHKQELVQKLKELEEKNRELSEQRLELSNMKLTHKTLLADFQDTKDKLLDTERKFQKIISERDQELQRAQAEISKLSTENSQKENLLKNIAQEKDKIIDENRRELDNLREERKQKESLATEHIQKSESLLLQSQQSHEMKETELKRITRELEEKTTLLQECCREKDSLGIKVEELQAQVKNLEGKLSETSQTAEKKSLEAKKYEENLEKLLKEQANSKSELKEMEKNVKENQTEVEKKAIELSNSQQLISAKQLELAQARSELQKCLEEIEQIKNLNLKEKEQFQQQDQTYKKMTADYEELSLLCEEKDQDQKHLKVKVADVELKLVEAENRYRELEARCASLEMQLEERFAQHQEAQKVIQMKEEMCHKLEHQLEERFAQHQEAQKVIQMKEEMCHKLEHQLEERFAQHQEAQKVIQMKEEMCHKLEHQLEERFAQHQEAQKVIQMKEEMCHKLERQLEERFAQHQEAQKVIQMKEEMCHKLERQLEERFAQHQEAQKVIQMKEEMCHKLEHQLEERFAQHQEAQKVIQMKEEMCHKLEHQLEERFAQHQEAQKVIQMKEEMCHKLERQLERIETDYEAATTQVQEAEKFIINRDKDFKQLQSRLEMVTKENDEIKTKLREKEAECQKVKEEFFSLEQEHDQIKVESLHLQHAYTESQKGHQVNSSEVKHLKDQLVALQSECKERKAKLEATEDQLLQVTSSCKKLEAELKVQTDHAVALQEDVRDLEKKWKETETLLKSSQQSLKSCESQVAKKDEEIKKLKFNINGKDVLITESKSELAKSEESLKFSEEKCQKLNEKLIRAEEKLAENSQLIPELTSRISTVEAALKEKESFCRDSQSGLSSLEQQYMEAKAECERLRSEVIHLQKQVDTTRITCVEAESNLKEVKFNLKNSEISLLESQKHVVELENTNKHLVSQLEHLSKTAADCDKKVEHLKESEEKYLKAISELGDLRTQVSHEVQKCSHLETQLTLVRQDAESKSTALVHLESSNAELVSAVQGLEQANAGLRSRLQEMESNHQSNESHFNQLEETNQNLAGKLYKLRETFNDCTNRLAAAEENNSKLKRERDEAVSRAGDLREQVRQLEARKKELEEKVELFKAENMKTQELEKSYSQAEDSRSQLEEKIIQLAQEVCDLKQEKVVLEDKLRETENKNIALSKEVSSLEGHHEETLSKMEQMKRDIEAFRAKDRTNEDKLKMLEKNLKELKDKKLSERVVELESKEKQLLEQIADIENTVIVPLEAENQELKDELSVVKQERDDAISRASRWGEDEVDMESLHKSLEDSLIHRDELEKKLNILNEDVAKLESEKESLMKQVSDFESSVSEYKDKIELLEDEVERLHHFEKQSSVVEEAETRLMDRVLDLEEREQMLLAELDKYKHRKVSSVAVQTEELSHEDLADRLKYLEQKNEVLQDAEGKYMDKIMELEETQYRLQAEVQSLKSGGGSEQPILSVSASATSTTAVLDKAADMRCVSTDTVGLLSASVQTFATDDLSLHCTDLESQNQKLLVELEEKSQKVQYLENKIELLHESEARLMDKLEESVGAGVSEDVSELKGKITNLTEENEFLAENVEKYKQLYKEEKEKMNELQDRLLEESSLYQELQEKDMELESVQKVLEELEDKVSELQARSRELNSQLDAARQDNTELRMKLEQISTNKQASKEEELQQLKKEMTQQFEMREQELCREIQNLKQHEEELQIRHDQQIQRLREAAESVSEREQGLIRELEALKLQLGDQEKEMIQLQQREVILLKKVDSMEKQDLNNKLSSLEDSVQSDSGLSADDQKFRYDQFERDLRERTATPAQEIFSSRVTLSLSRPGVQSPDPQPSHTTTPVAPPRKSKSRQASIDSTSQEELSQLVDELQHKVAAQKKRILDLESAADADLYGRVQELECMNHNLERRLRYAEGLRLSSAEEGKYSSFYLSGDNNNNNTEASVKRSSSYNMLDKPEDILQQKIRDLENLDKHNKNQLSELEHDREILHEIARKDKSTIHDLQVKIRELQLTERSLKEQVNSLENSEGSLFTKCEELTSVKSQLEDRVHELEIHERRLRELVRRLKLDEEHWLSKSGGMETAVAELSASETQLRKLLQNIEMEKGGLSERARYLEARVGELETVELTLLQKLKNFEINEVTLKNRLVQLENSEAAAHSKATELDVVNVDLSQRLQKAVEECAMLSQHVSQLQGQIQDLDRRLLSSKDSELAYKHHVESLQKNESLLQKKVREYELREIDSQASVRELEQNNRILNDKLGALQRSENKLKFRVQELEGLTGQVPGELSPEQKKKVPQKLEDCQKFVIALQKQVENLQLQLREAVTPIQLASQTKESGRVSLPVDEYNELQTKSVLLEESTYQVEELEQLHQQLSDTILQLRQGKDASGHEVEVEVLKRRLNSYKTLINKLKSSLSKGQATSLLDPEQDSGPLGSTLPAHPTHGLESERVLQAVRSNQNGKADTSKVGGAQLIGPQTQEISIVQSTDKSSLSSPPANSLGDVIKKFEQPLSREESHWKAIEARKPKEVAGLRGETKATVGAAAKPVATPGSKRSSTPEVGEVTIALHLQSESELSSHHRTTQNDTDSCDSPVPPPRRGRVFRAGKNSGSESQSAESDDLAKPATAANNKHYFGNEKSLPTSANTSQRTRRAPLTRFGDDSFYLPSSAQEGVDSLDDGEAPPLPSTEPPGVVKARSSQVLTQPLKLDMEDSVESSTSGLSIRERIAMIEKQLQSDHSGSKADYEQILTRKKRPNDNLKQAEAQERDNKYLKDDINRLERELEEKRRFIHLVELWLSNLEELLKNKTKQTDREMLECLQRDLTKLRTELKNVGYRSQDAVLDAAALKTELEHRDRDIVTKRHEVEALSQELRRCQEECLSIEGMRRTALDSLRSLEKEVIDLQETEVRLKEAQVEIQTLRLQSEDKNNELNEVIREKNEFEFTLKKTILERDHLKCDLNVATEEREKLLLTVEEMKERLEVTAGLGPKNSSLEEQLKSLNSLLQMRTEKTQEVYTENLSLRDRLHQSELELIRLRNLCDDYNNLSARYDELENYKSQALNMLQPLQAKLDRLTLLGMKKDDLLNRLRSELRHVTYRPSSALHDLMHMDHIDEQGDYRGFSPSSSPPQRHKIYSRSASVDDLELSDTGSSNSVPGMKKKRPSPYTGTRPRSADNMTTGSMVRGTHAHPRPLHGTRRSEPPLAWPGVTRGQFIALADYEPALFSQSGRPGLELQLREGDCVIVTGPMDRTGYYEAEVNGRTGLVPANYLEPLSGSEHMIDYNMEPWLLSSPAQVNMTSLAQVPDTKVKDGTFTRHKETNNKKIGTVSQNGQSFSMPDPPQHLHVKGVGNDRTLLLSWSPPKLDKRGNTNGFKLLGYMVYLNNQAYEQISSPKLCEVVVEGLTPGSHQLLAVQCLCAGGQVSPRAELVLEGVVKLMDSQAYTEPASDAPDTDLSSVLNSVHYKRGHRKAVMALYDYSPKHQSPHDYTVFELAFMAGDIIHVYGEPRPDGFYHGEMDGNRGLVPACFVEDVSHMTNSMQRGGRESEPRVDTTS